MNCDQRGLSVQRAALPSRHMRDCYPNTQTHTFHNTTRDTINPLNSSIVACMRVSYQLRILQITIGKICTPSSIGLPIYNGNPYTMVTLCQGTPQWWTLPLYKLSRKSHFPVFISSLTTMSRIRNQITLSILINVKKK